MGEEVDDWSLSCWRLIGVFNRSVVPFRFLKQDVDYWWYDVTSFKKVGDLTEPVVIWRTGWSIYDGEQATSLRGRWPLDDCRLGDEDNLLDDDLLLGDNLLGVNDLFFFNDLLCVDDLFYVSTVF